MPKLRASFLTEGFPLTGLAKLSRRSFMVLPIVAAACKPAASVLELSGLSMGTTWNVVAVNAPKSVDGDTLMQTINAALSEVNLQMSNWDPQSEVSRINTSTSAETHQLSAGLSHVMQAAEFVRDASLGRFDTTVGPLVELWGFGATGSRSHVPTEDAVAQSLSRVGHGNTLQIGDGTLRKTSLDAQIYLAAIGKGYGADRVGAALQELGISDFMVEIGGDLYASGRNPQGGQWQIGIEAPQTWTRGVMQVVGISDLGMASSGDYRNYFEQDGQRFSHVIDPTTGRPITHRTASATVLAENGMLADAWATAMLTLGRDKGLEIAEKHNIAVLFVDRDPSVRELQFTATASSQFTALQA